MKNFFILMAIILISEPSYALIASVESLDNFSTKNPPKTIKVKVLKDFRLTNDLKIFQDCVIEGSIKVKPPKRFKRNATFTFVPLNYSYTEDDVLYINEKRTGKYVKPISKGDVAKSVALKAGNTVVPGLSTGYNIVKSAAENEEGNAAKSVLKSLYDNSPLSFVKKGNDIEIKKDDKFNIFFRPQRNKVKKYKVLDNCQNNEYIREIEH